MAGQPISISTAEDMQEAYINYMTSLGVNMEDQTHDITLTGNSLVEWLTDVQTHANELKIVLAAYPDSHPKAGRLTAILWPYQDGQRAKDTEGNEIEPYNDGQLGP